MDLAQMLAPLQLVEAAGGSVSGRTKFQKLMFLVQEEGNAGKPFRYIAYDYGPYSKELQNTLNVLVDLDLLEERASQGRAESTVYTYHITAPGKQFLAASADNPEVVKRAAAAKQAASWNHRKVDDLIDYVYKTYPAYAVNSKLH